MNRERETLAEATDDDVVADIDPARLRPLTIASIAWSMLKQWGSRLISIGLFVVLARTLDPSDFGLAAFAAVFIGVVELPIRMSLGDAIVQQPALKTGQLDSALWGLVGISSLVGAIVAGTAAVVGAQFSDHEVVPLIIALSLVLPLSGASVVPEALMRRQMKFKALAVRTLLADTLGGAVGLVLAFAGAGAWALVIRMIVTSAGLAVLTFATVDWTPRFRFRWSDVREIATFGGWSSINSAIGYASRHVDDLVIGATLGALALGYYVIAYQLLTIAVLLVTNTLDATAMSAFSRLQGDAPRIGRAFTLGVRMSLVIVSGLSAMTVALAPSIIVFFFGDKWLASTDLLRVLIVGSLVAPTLSLSVTVMKSQGRPDLAVRLAAVRTAVAIVAIVFASTIGLLWVGVAQIATAALVCPFYLRTVNRLSEVQWRALGWVSARIVLAGASGASVAIVAAGTWNEPVGSFWRLVFATTVGTVVYGGFAWLVARSELREMVALVRSGIGGRGTGKRLAEVS